MLGIAGSSTTREYWKRDGSGLRTGYGLRFMGSLRAPRVFALWPSNVQESAVLWEQKGDGCSWKIQSLETLKSLTFQGPGLRMILKMGVVCFPVDDALERSVNK